MHLFLIQGDDNNIKVISMIHSQNKQINSPIQIVSSLEKYNKNKLITNQPHQKIWIIQKKNNSENLLLTQYTVHERFNKRMQALKQQINQYNAVASLNGITVKTVYFNKNTPTTIGIIRNFKPRSPHLLKTLIQKCQKIDKVQFMKQIVQHIATLHDHNIIHGNLNLESVSYHENVVVDCPLFRNIERSQRRMDNYRIEQSQQKMDVYRPAKVWKQTGLNALSDVYAIGLIFLQLLTGKLIQSPKTQQQIRTIIQILLSKLDETIIKQLIRKMLVKNQFLRLTIKEVYKCLDSLENTKFQLVHQIPMKVVMKLDIFHSPQKQTTNIFKYSPKQQQHTRNHKCSINNHYLSIQLSKSGKITFYIQSNTTLQLSNSLFIPTDCLPFPSNYYFSSTSQLYQCLVIYSDYIELTNCGELVLKLGEQDAREYSNRTREWSEYIIRRNQMICENVGEVRTFDEYYGKTKINGCLVGRRYVLTVAQAMYNRQFHQRANFFTFKAGKRQLKGVQFQYPVQYTSKSEESPIDYQFGLMMLQANYQVKKDLYLSVVYDFDQAKMQRRVQQCDSNLSFLYICDEKILLPQFIQIKQDRIYSKLIFQKGSPILVYFSNGRMAVIGISVGSSCGLLYTKSRAWQLLSWIKSNNVLQSEFVRYLSFKVYSADNWIFDRQQPKHLNSGLGIGLQIIVDINNNLKNIKNASQSRMKVDTAFIFQLNGHKNHNFSKIQQFNRALNIYTELYGQNCWKLSTISNDIAVNTLQTDPQISLAHFQTSAELQSIYKWNPIMLIYSAIKMAQFYMPLNRHVSRICIRYALDAQRQFHNDKQLYKNYNTCMTLYMNYGMYEQACSLGLQCLPVILRLKEDIMVGTFLNIIKELANKNKIKDAANLLLKIFKYIYRSQKYSFPDMRLAAINLAKLLVSKTIEMNTISQQLFVLIKQIIGQYLKQNKSILDCLKNKIVC